VRGAVAVPDVRNPAGGEVSVEVVVQGVVELIPRRRGGAVVMTRRKSRRRDSGRQKQQGEG
jgi:hypothetical protein